MVCTLILSSCPSSFQFSIDLHSWTITSSRFKGIKNIPSGLHFISYSSGEEAGLRSGVWIDATKEKHIMAWDQEAQEFLAYNGDISSDHPEVAPYLAPYPPSTVWPLLTSYIRSDLIDEILPSWSMTSLTSSTTEAAQLSDRLPDHPEETRIRYTSIRPSRSWKPGATASEITRDSMDKSTLLASLVNGSSSPETNSSKDKLDILGEMQLAFLHLLLLSNYSSLEHWKNIIHVSTFSQSYLLDNPEYFSEFIDILTAQLKNTPEDFWVDILTDSSLYTEQQSLHHNISEISHIGLDKSLQSLLDFLSEAYEIDVLDNRVTFLNDEDQELVSLDAEDAEAWEEKGEYAPVVVNLEESG
ncbi:Protein AAR2 [Neolecta irregularis DAH-3]|uniref:Protein AAR2 n=1 Tax=Neolecta irregularis (strain DAH-3) TaxID=1198029 RepID=A0A1U7LVE5_NEOID|nr:Protein AAR2 [Neolecta irregularis DAH-3]|eukprot:OLL26614.1 Protein AAR2 [Neolecta irregularis DAH-3]